MSKQDTINISERIKRIRTELGMSIPELARYSGVSPKFIENLEADANTETIKKYLSVVKTLGAVHRHGIHSLDSRGFADQSESIPNEGTRES